jgi:CheY-like chemotaxis protein
VAEDDSINQRVAQGLLKTLGYHVDVVNDGRAAVNAWRSGRYDLILMDGEMPEMDGYEATRTMRAMPQFEQLPIVALTAKAMKGDREKSIASGASDYITKPVDVDQLLALMRVWLYR